MFKLTIKEVVSAVKGSLIAGDENIEIRGVSTDSRTIKPGEIFFALTGPNFDGNRFAGAALKKGASAIVVNAPLQLPGIPEGQPVPACFKQGAVVYTDDVLEALGRLARYWRIMYPLPLIAVSGSCGKTTTKEMIASILRVSRTIIKTEGNMNNLIGMPLTLLGLDKRHNAAVVELGISERGEMTRLVNICMPDVSVLTNICEAHLKTLKNIEGVAYAKGEIFSGLKPDGIAVVNIDDPWIVKITEPVKQKKITFSLETDAVVSLKGYSKRDGIVDAQFRVRGRDIKAGIVGEGLHNLSDVACAIAASLAVGAEEEDIVRGLGDFKPLHGRMEVIRLNNSVTVIDDTYNANPASVESSLRSLADMKGRRIAVLGDMLELGDASRDRHKNIGRIAGRLGLDILFAVGEFSRDITDGAVEVGMGCNSIMAVSNKSDAVEGIKDIISSGDILLVKGSRAAGMEDVVEKLVMMAGGRI